MSNDKALAVIPRTLPEVQSMAEVLAKSALMPDALKGKVPDVVVQILAGQELGLAPMAAIRGVHIVQGKPLLSADTMVALCLSSGSCEYFSVVNETETSVTYETKRKGSPHPQKYTWSDEDTKAAGLNQKDNWRLHKKQMRRARAKAILARDVYPDVLAGVYDEHEIPAREPVRVVEREPEAVDAEIVETPLPGSLEERILSTKTVEDLRAMAREINGMPKGSEARTRMKAAWDAHHDRLLKASIDSGAPASEPAA